MKFHKNGNLNTQCESRKKYTSSFLSFMSYDLQFYFGNMKNKTFQKLLFFDFAYEFIYLFLAVKVYLYCVCFANNVAKKSKGKKINVFLGQRTKSMDKINASSRFLSSLVGGGGCAPVPLSDKTQWKKQLLTSSRSVLLPPC